MATSTKERTSGIDLRDHFGMPQAGLIVEQKTGVVWNNQVGGNCCDHMETEGWLAPLDMKPRYLRDMHKHLCGPYWSDCPVKHGRITDHELKMIQLTLWRMGPMDIDLERLPELKEAWIPVVVKYKKAPPKYPMRWSEWKELDKRKGIFTYENCD